MTEQDNVRWRNAQGIGEVSIRGRSVGIHAGFARAALAGAEASIVVREEVHAEVAEPGVELRPPTVPDVAIIAVRNEHPGRVWRAPSRRDDPCGKRCGISRLERHGPFAKGKRRVWWIYRAGARLVQQTWLVQSDPDDGDHVRHADDERDHLQGIEHGRTSRAKYAVIPEDTPAKGCWIDHPLTRSAAARAGP
jgi:hypothetical protein